MFKKTEAISFVDNVKSQFVNDPQKYHKFLDIMKRLKGNVCVLTFLDFILLTDHVAFCRIDPGDVVLQIAALFNGYPDLTREFNAFLPPGYRLQPRGEGVSSCIILSTPEGTTVYPRDYVRLR